LSALLSTLTGLLRLLAGILLAALLAALLSRLLLATLLLLVALLLLVTLVVLVHLGYSLNPRDLIQRTPQSVVPSHHLTVSNNHAAAAYCSDIARRTVASTRIPTSSSA